MMADSDTSRRWSDQERFAYQSGRRRPDFLKSMWRWMEDQYRVDTEDPAKKIHFHYHPALPPAFKRYYVDLRKIVRRFKQENAVFRAQRAERVGSLFRKKLSAKKAKKHKADHPPVDVGQFHPLADQAFANLRSTLPNRARHCLDLGNRLAEYEERGHLCSIASLCGRAQEIQKDALLAEVPPVWVQDLDALLTGMDLSASGSPHAAQALEGWIRRLDERLDDSLQHNWSEQITPPTPWAPPSGHVGVKEIMTDQRFMKNGKNPPRATIQDWVNRKDGSRVQAEQAPDTLETYYPESWVHEQIRRWNPRKPKDDPWR